MHKTLLSLTVIACFAHFCQVAVCVRKTISILSFCINMSNKKNCFIDKSAKYIFAIYILFFYILFLVKHLATILLRSFILVGDFQTFQFFYYIIKIHVFLDVEINYEKF